MNYESVINQRRLQANLPGKITRPFSAQVG